MKHTLLQACLLLLLSLLAGSTLGQTGGSVGIGTSTPAASAALDLTSTSKGFLPPRMTVEQRNAIASPAAGLSIFNTTSGQLNYYDGKQWRESVAVAADNTSVPAGGTYTYTVPAGVTSLRVELAGASGGSSVGNGGRGGLVQAQLSVKPGQVLYAVVGGSGVQGPIKQGGGGIILRTTDNEGSGGFNGGASTMSGVAGGGGGASDLRVGGTALANRVLVAGGGGGGGYYLNSTGGEAGGSGGNQTGATGLYHGALTGGKGGSQTAGGKGATNDNPYWVGNDGVLGEGGIGGGGGGGGGYYGGGGGANYRTQYAYQEYGSGGGGGSSYAAPSTSELGISNVTMTPGVQSGDGYVTITPLYASYPAPALDVRNFVNSPWRKQGTMVSTTVGSDLVGIGTSSPSAQLEVQLPASTAAASLKLEHRGSNLIVRPLNGGNSASIIENTAGNLLLEPSGQGNVGINQTNPTYRLDVGGSIYATGVIISSDQRFKTQVRPITGALAGVQQLRGVRYRLNALGLARGGNAGEQVGFLAQELEKVYPELVSTDNQGYKSVNYSQLTAVLVEALKEQQRQLDQQQTQLTELRARLGDQQADHAALLTLQAQLARLLGEAPPSAPAPAAR
ncbi:tail fiber domain-containing protein [Hymenobacter defluvii]|uniref:receptor protein-tyrosine kinase n=1 Tax=Hymenobacter defluvii TaxID=2054411 RepID=A0ABS3TBL0_9BACT|nr:tail fiber domain-containing protein [Hymenobacter defluvii]MBO3271042.1 tail fiber domain-containing protein [Hymenobacter defluvii]